MQDKLTYREFIEWLIFLQIEDNRETKMDYYLAQIAAEVRRGQAKNPKLVKVKDFIVQFMTPQQSKAKYSKDTWAALLKVKLPKT